MERIVRTAWLICLTALFAIAFSHAADAVVVHLQVADKGKAVADATIVLFDEQGKEESRMVTDAEGRLTLDLRDGSYKVTVETGMFGPPNQTAHISNDIGEEAAKSGKVMTPNGAVATAIAAALGSAKPTITGQETSPMILVTLAEPVMMFFVTFDIGMPGASKPSAKSSDDGTAGFSSKAD